MITLYIVSFVVLWCLGTVLSYYLTKGLFLLFKEGWTDIDRNECIKFSWIINVLLPIIVMVFLPIAKLCSYDGRNAGKNSIMKKIYR